MASIKVVLRQKINKDGSYPLALRLTKDRRTTYVYLAKNVRLSEWDSVTHKVKTSHPNSKRLNIFLLQQLSKANNALLELELQRPDFSLQMLKEKIIKKTDTDTFYAQATIYFDTIIKEGKFNRHSSESPALSHMKRFLKGRDIAFQDITVQLLESFKAYLKGDQKVSERTAINYLITIRSIYNRAIKAGIVDPIHYPFGRGKMSLKRPESPKIGLEKEEVMLIENLELDESSFLHHARNLWLFSFYFAGMRASDVLLLRWSDFKNNRLYYTMGKNLKTGSLKIPQKAKFILKQYKDQKAENNGFVFPDLKDIEDMKETITLQKKLKYRIRKADKALKKIAVMIELSKPLTMHIARHTFGNISGDKIPIQKLQQLYRHSSIITTIGYQKAFLYKGTDDALDAVLNF